MGVVPKGWVGGQAPGADEVWRARLGAGGCARLCLALVDVPQADGSSRAHAGLLRVRARQGPEDRDKKDKNTWNASELIEEGKRVQQKTHDSLARSPPLFRPPQSLAPVCCLPPP